MAEVGYWYVHPNSQMQYMIQQQILPLGIASLQNCLARPIVNNAISVDQKVTEHLVLPEYMHFGKTK